MSSSSYLILFFIPMFVGCSVQQNLKIKDLFFLQGEWQVQGKEQFEKWNVVNDFALSGQGYKIFEEKKDILEVLQIVEEKGNVFYQATVPDQNEGATISFKGRKRGEGQFEFSNPDHDFPQTIVYDRLHPDTIHVTVKGGNKGFDFFLYRTNIDTLKVFQ